MDTQPTPSNSPRPEVAPSVLRPEDLRPDGPVLEAPRPEVAPAPGGGAPPPALAPAVSPPAKLSPDDVAAAIAAVPGPGGTQPAATPAPATADDVDVIEPEWVAKAEDVVRSHAGDPYSEEEAIEVLQKDYLQKRYGLNVANPNSDSNKPEGT